jgi:hypothetical protein
VEVATHVEGPDGGSVEVETVAIFRDEVLQACRGPTAQVAEQRVAQELCDALGLVYSGDVQVQFLSEEGSPWVYGASARRLYRVIKAASTVKLIFKRAHGLAASTS